MTDGLNIDDITVMEHTEKDKFLEQIKEISKKLPNGEEQYESIKQFTEGKVSYAEMRMRFG